MNKLTTYILFTFFLTFYFSAIKSQSKPNIIFILTDDQAPWALGYSGDPNADTPNLDLLAEKGAYLENAFITTPVCSPSRASIMTGRYASEFNILDFIPKPSHNLYDPDYAPGLEPESVTFAEIIRDAGYYTGLIGKWHLGDWSQTTNKKYHPTNHGFDYFMGLQDGGTSPDNPVLEKDGETKEYKGLTTDILTDNAIEFIQDHHKKPFLLCFNTRAPHGRWLPVSEADWAPFENMDPKLPNPNYPDLKTEEVKKDMKEYLASTRGVDRNLARIFKELDRLGIFENTVIVFYSDHGYNMGHNGIKHKGNGIWVTKSKQEPTEYIIPKYRPNMYDNSLKVPAIIFWPGVIKPGIKIKETITSLDLFPTLVEIAGGIVHPSIPIRGRSFLPLLKQEKIPDWDNDYYGEYSMINYCKSFMRCYRTEEWKLVIDFMNPERNELYHIAYDPEENINLYTLETDEVKRIKEDYKVKIISKMKEIDDPLVKQEIVNPFYYKSD